MTLELHGIEVKEVDNGLRAITFASDVVVGITGTAGKGAKDTPLLINGSRAKATTVLGPLNPGDGFTLRPAIDAVLDHSATNIVAINVIDPATDTADITDEAITFNSSTNKAKTAKPFVSSFAIETGMEVVQAFKGDKITLPSGITSIDAIKSKDGVTTYTVTDDYTIASNVVSRVTDGAITADQEVLVEYTATAVANTDYTLDAETGDLVRTVASTIAKGSKVLANYTHVDPTAASESDIIGGASAGSFTGVHALLTAQSELGVKPNVLIAPGWTHQKADAATANGVVAELQGIVDKLAAFAVVDAGDVSYDDFIDYVTDWAGDDRIIVAYPFVKVSRDSTVYTEPFSARLAGVMAESAATRGFQESPSNKQVKGIVGVSKTIDFELGNKTSLANLINKNNGVTIVSYKGFRTWGNRAADGSFINIRAIRDRLQGAVQEALIWALDRNITKPLINEIELRIQAAINELIAQRALLSGTVRIDSELNTDATLSNGQLYIDTDFTAPAPLEHGIVNFKLDNKYELSLFDN